MHRPPASARFAFFIMFRKSERPFMIAAVAAHCADHVNWRWRHIIRLFASMKPTTLATVAVALLICGAIVAYRRSGHPAPPSAVVDQAGPSEPLSWPAGTTMEAIVRTDVILPGSILANDEVFNSVIQISSNDALISFEPATARGSAFKSITVRLEPGMRLTLKKRADVWAQEVGGKPGAEFHMRLIEHP
jgi:hypothetical protein